MDVTFAHWWKGLQKRWRYMLLWCLLAVVVTGLVSYYLITPEYEATAKLIVQSESGSVNYSELLSNRELLTTYAEVLRSNQITEDVIRRLGLTISPEDLQKKLRTQSSGESLIVSVSVRDPDYAQAVAIVNAFAQSFLDNIHHIMRVGNVTILDQAKEDALVKPKPVRPKPILNMAMALIVSCVLFSLYVLYKELTNNTIRSAEEVEDILHLPILGLIPDLNEKPLKNKRKEMEPRRGESMA